MFAFDFDLVELMNEWMNELKRNEWIGWWWWWVELINVLIGIPTSLSYTNIVGISFFNYLICFFLIWFEMLLSDCTPSLIWSS